MKRITAFLAIIYLFHLHGIAQQTNSKKALDHADFDIWKSIVKPQISSDGRWVIYELNPSSGDGVLVIYDGKNAKEQRFERAKSAKISADSRFVVFKITPFEDTLKTQRRKKVKKEDLPKDSLGILVLSTMSLTKIPEVQSFLLPEKWNGWLAYLKEPFNAKTETQKDTSEQSQPKKLKKENNDNGSKLVIRDLNVGREDTLGYVTSFVLAEAKEKFAAVSSGDESTLHAGVYIFEGTTAQWQPIFRKKGTYKNLTFDELGNQLAFVADLDTTKVQIKPYGLHLWQNGRDSTQLVADDTATFLPESWRISENAALHFSKDATKLIFGIAPKPILRDTSLLEEEIVHVEVWAHDDPDLPTMQNVRVIQEKKRTYESVYHVTNQKLVQLASTELREIQLGDERNAAYALAYDDKPYGVQRTWEWWDKQDLYLVDVETGLKKNIGKGIEGSVRFSPKAKYVYWFSEQDTAWIAYSMETGTTQRITDNKNVLFYDELDDHPDVPPSYGVAGWLENDMAVLIYDRYDIWKIDPTGKTPPILLTKGRGTSKVFRYINTDVEKRFLFPNERILLAVFDEKTKASGYAWLDLTTNQITNLQSGNYSYTETPLKAKNADKWVFTRESFESFPDLLYSNDLKTFTKISDANPQQKNYLWGTASLYQWTSLDGEKLEGLLFKPANFDAKKQYPMIVYFYERNSNTLHRHRAPEPPRSSINFTFYTSKGYVVFVPDIPYKIGYPGESCYNAVMPGISSLIDEGFINPERIGVQGHSWGGYQIAYLLTRTNIFKCAEAGAPVVNMFSAYGGIRWGSGMSRSAQYERTQSRIGGSIWDYPLRYVENSPLFSADKIKTPVLILHNDNDDAVPWYQGIEFYIAMRRLNNPAWLLNYNSEPHGIMKRQNRMDFNRRMQQFFDYYLQDAPQPQWMERGIPAIEKGIKQGFELILDEK